jgi:hypothetical protein
MSQRPFYASTTLAIEERWPLQRRAPSPCPRMLVQEQVSAAEQESAVAQAALAKAEAAVQDLRGQVAAATERQATAKVAAAAVEATVKADLEQVHQLGNMVKTKMISTTEGLEQVEKLLARLLDTSGSSLRLLGLQMGGATSEHELSGSDSNAEDGKDWMPVAGEEVLVRTPLFAGTRSAAVPSLACGWHVERSERGQESCQSNETLPCWIFIEMSIIMQCAHQQSLHVGDSASTKRMEWVVVPAYPLCR